MQFRTRLTGAVSVAAAAIMLASPVLASPQEASPGAIVGTIRDEYNGMTLPTAMLFIDVLSVQQAADMDGNYRLDVAPGTYDVRVSFPGYEDRIVTGVKVAAGAVVEVDVALRLSGRSVEETVVVTATADPELATVEAQLLERKRAGAISDNLAREEMRQNADSDAASAMRRVTGLSVVDNQYVYVRGLGKRYSNTMLNGSVLPSTEPDKRVIPLDLIPTSMIESVQVIKSYLPDKPAEFSGGLVQIEAITNPRSENWSLGSKQTINSKTSFKSGLGYPGSASDWLGFDGGLRALPSAIPTDQKLVPGSFVTGLGFSQEDLARAGRSFENIWDPRPVSYDLDQAFTAGYGNKIGKVGLITSVGYRSKPRTRTEDQTFYFVGEDENGDPALGVQNDYDFELSNRRSRLGVLGSLSYQAAANHRFTWSNFWTHNSRNETRVFQGFNSDVRADLRDQRLYWTEENIFSSSLRGEHLIPTYHTSRIDWRLNVARAKRHEPDLREVLYELDPSRDKFVLADESQSGFRMFNDLNEELHQGGADWSLFFTQWDGLPSQLKLGGEVAWRDRDFISRRFRFRHRNTRGLDLSLPAEQLFVPENIGTAFQLREETRNTDTYKASHDLVAAYAMVDLPLGLKWRLVGGLRVESSRQRVETFDLFNVNRQPVEAALDDTDILPGVNLIYRAGPNVNLRAGFSRTVNRPEFRELSPFEFTDVVGGRAVVGNPGLQRATIDNFDLRWEWFVSSDEILAVSGFYKHFAQPIERVVEPTAQLRTSFVNADSASNVGIELEARKNFSRSWGVNLNYSYVHSMIQVGRQVGQVQTTTRRPLAGQSPHVVNAQLIFRHPKLDLDARLLFHYFGARITDVGALGLPDIFEAARGTVDFVVARHFGPWAVSASAGNLTNRQVLFTQGGLPQRRYRTGRDMFLSLGYSPR